MQTRRQSLYEALENTAWGFSYALVLSFMIFPLCGVHTEPHQNVAVTAIYTAASVLRGYVVRRRYNRKMLRGT